jgi:hypothetical protein
MRYLLCRLELTALSTPPSWGVRKRLAVGDSGRHALETSGTVASVPAARYPEAEEEK